MTRFTNSKVVSINECRPTGRMFPLEAQSTTSRSSASSSKYTTSVPVTYDNPIFACANKRTPIACGAPAFSVIHLCLVLNAGRTNRPLVFGLRLLKTYDRGSPAAQEFCGKVHWYGLIRERPFW